MNDQRYQALLQEVLRAPQEDAPRLILADWLEEEGQAERAEFIRVGVELGQIPLKPNQHKSACEKDMMFGIVVANCELCKWLWTFDKRQKLLRLRGTELEATRTTGLFPAWLEPPLIDFDDVGVIQRRGFVAEIHVKAEEWLQHADCLLQQHPMENVTLTTFPKLDHQFDRKYRRHIYTVPGREFDWQVSESVWFQRNVEQRRVLLLEICQNLLKQIWPQITFKVVYPSRSADEYIPAAV